MGLVLAAKRYGLPQRVEVLGAVVADERFGDGRFAGLDPAVTQRREGLRSRLTA